MKHLERDLEELKRELLTMGSMVEEAIDKAISAFLGRNRILAEEVKNGDRNLDDLEVRIEESCLKILALHQPVAHDLRFIIAMMKVNNDLERMGDTAVNIAERAAYLAEQEPVRGPLEFARMTDLVREMVRESLDALINSDVEKARWVCAQDDQVDTINRQMFVILQRIMMEDTSCVERAVHTLSISRHLERIADLATNIAEDVVFMVEGEIVRHRLEDFSRRSQP